jgi:hypothetical protein
VSFETIDNGSCVIETNQRISKSFVDGFDGMAGYYLKEGDDERKAITILLSTACDQSTTATTKDRLSQCLFVNNNASATTDLNDVDRIGVECFVCDNKPSLAFLSKSVAESSLIVPATLSRVLLFMATISLCCLPCCFLSKSSACC